MRLRYAYRLHLPIASCCPDASSSPVDAATPLAPDSESPDSELPNCLLADKAITITIPIMKIAPIAHIPTNTATGNFFRRLRCGCALSVISDETMQLSIIHGAVGVIRVKTIRFSYLRQKLGTANFTDK